MPDATFRAAVQASRLDVTRSALLFARSIAYPELDIDHYLFRLQEIAREARGKIDSGSPALDQARALTHDLFVDGRWQGNVSDYSDPRNSFFNEVIDRGLGIPITLSLLFVTVARQLGLQADGVNMPGHYLAQVRDGRARTFFDPFHQGRELSQSECKALARDISGYAGPFRDEWLAPAEPRATLARMLNNLRLHYAEAGQWDEAITTMAHLQLVEPDEPTHYRDLAILHYQKGALARAAYHMEAYLAADPDAADGPLIKANARHIMARWARLN